MTAGRREGDKLKQLQCVDDLIVSLVPLNSLCLLCLVVLNCVILCVCRFLIVLGCLILAILTTFREHEKVSAHWLVILVRPLWFLGFVASQDQVLPHYVAFKSCVFWCIFWFQLCEVCTWNKWTIQTKHCKFLLLHEVEILKMSAASFLRHDRFKMNFCGFKHVSVLCFDLRWDLFSY